MVERGAGRAILDGMFKPLDVIELRVGMDAWEAGTIATVLEVKDDHILAEIADNDGRTLDVITLPLAAVTPRDDGNGAGHLRTSSDISRLRRPFSSP